MLTLQLRADVGMLLLLVGALLTLLGLPPAVVAVYAAGRRARELEAARAAWADDRRRFLQRLDHELKNPLTALRAGLANLASLSVGPERDTAQASVEAQLTRLNRLVGNLRKLVELEQRPLERVPADVGELLTEVVDLAIETPDRQISLTLLQAPWPLPPASGDRDLIFLACYNLVDNARKFTRPGDAIEVRAFEDGRWIAIEVADTDPGSRRRTGPTCSRSCTGVTTPARWKGAGWDWPWCAPWHGTTAAVFLCAAARARVRPSRCGCPRPDLRDEVVTPCDGMVTGLSHDFTGSMVY